MKTLEEILAFYQAHQGRDFLGFAAEVLVPYLPFDLAKSFLKPEVTADQWTSKPIAEDAIREDMRDYMAFAWSKVDDHRGISASRSVEKMGAWLWLLGDEEMYALTDDDARYAQYGAPILKAISEKYEFPIPAGERIERMARGEKCRPDCDEGCGT